MHFYPRYANIDLPCRLSTRIF